MSADRVTEQPEDWPAWATEKVAVVAPDPHWQELGRHEAAAVAQELGPVLAGEPEHVGSTAVPGLPAKPIVDLIAAVPSWDAAAVAADVLAPHGWHFVPAELDGRPWRRFFVKVRHGHRVAHLQLVRRESSDLAEQVAFRDALRGSPQLVAAYAELKRRLSEQFGDDREAYTRGKTAFVRQALRRGTGATGALSDWRGD